MKRLQGKDFVMMKSDLEIIGYTKSFVGHYCAIMQIKGSGVHSQKYTHWLNDEEINKFIQSNYFKTHAPLSKEQLENIKKLEEIGTKVFKTLGALNNLYLSILDEQNQMDNKKLELFNTYTREVIYEVYEGNKNKFNGLKCIL